MSVQVDVNSGRDLIWQVLTDYENLHRFVPGMRSSRIVSGPGQPLLLEQRGESGILFIKVTTELTSRILEFPKEEIRFELVRGNLKGMTGAWALHGHDHAMRVAYRAHVVLESALPPLIGRAVMAHNIKTMIEGVVGEIDRRTAAGGGRRQGAKPETPDR